MSRISTPPGLRPYRSFSLRRPGGGNGGVPIPGLPGGASAALALGNYSYVGAVHQNTPLSQLVLGYDISQMFIADQVIPPLPVNYESDLYYRFDKSPWFRREETRTPDRESAREVQFSFDSATYSADRFALATSISDRERRNSDDQLRLEETSLQFIKQLLMLDTEIRAAALLTKANTSGVTLAGAEQWDNASYTPPSTNQSIERRFDTAKEAVRQATGGFLPNTVIIPSATAKVMKRDAIIRDLIKYTTNALVNGDLPDTLWGLKVIIPGTVYTTSNEGVAEGSITYTDIWGKDVRILYVPPVPAIRIPATAYQFRVASENFNVYEWREERTRCDYYEVGVLQDMRLTSATSCYVIENPIA